MLSFTRKTDYALISLTHMACQGSNSSSAREIATRYRMPMPLLMNVLKVLTQHGLARSERGPRGGYQLARPAEEINLHDIIAAVDGPVALVLCVRGAQRRDQSASGERQACGCELTSLCPVRGAVHKVHDKLVKMLKEVTLADLADHAKRSRAPRATPTTRETEHEVAHLS